MQKEVQPLVQQGWSSPYMSHSSETQELQLASSATPCVHSSCAHVQGPSPQMVPPPLDDDELDELEQVTFPQKASAACMQA